MEPEVLIPLIFAGVFLLIDALMLVRMISLLKKSKDETVKDLGDKLNPYLYATGIVSVLMAICMIVVVCIK